jgi:hypothetical protein
MSQDRFDEWLGVALRDQPEPEDAGFSLRVMAALPAQRTRRLPARTGFTPAMRAAEIAAISTAALALGYLPLQGMGGLDALAAACSLLALLLWWSLPQSRGSGWR